MFLMKHFLSLTFFAALYQVTAAGEFLSRKSQQAFEKPLDRDRLQRSLNSYYDNVEQYLMKTMDLSVNPCKNFYKFVCGKITGDEIIDQVRTKNWNRLKRKLLHDDVYLDQAPPSIRTAIVATQNLDTKSATEDDKYNLREKIVNEFMQVSGISRRIFDDDNKDEPTAKQLGRAIGYLASRSLFPLFNMGTDRSRSFSATKKPYAFDIWPKYMKDNSDVASLSYDVDLVESRIRNSFSKLPWPDKNRQNRIAQNIKTFQSFLSESGTYDWTMEYMTPIELNQKFTYINWTEMVMEAGRNIADESNHWKNLIPHTRTQVFKWPFLMRLNDAFHQQQFNRTLLAQFLLVTMLNDVPDVYFSKRSEWERWIPPGLLLAYSRIYADSIFSNANERENLQATINQLTDNIKEAWHDMIEESTWLSATSKQKALVKLSKVQKNLMLPEPVMNNTFLSSHYASLNINGNDSFISTMEKLQKFAMARQLEDIFDASSYPLASFFLSHDKGVITTNAWRSREYNAITVPLGDIQSPLYDANWPAFHTYGSVGFIIGHEFGHAFDNEGIAYGEDGQVENVFDSGTMKTYNNYADCMANEYSNMCYRMYDANLECLNGQRTLPENMADHSGMRAAYRAFQTFRQRNDTQLSHLDESALSQYNPDQLFFAYFARYWCKSGPASENELADVHSPNGHRVLGTLRNFPAFQTAFDCPDSSAMVSSRRCELWNDINASLPVSWKYQLKNLTAFPKNKVEDFPSHRETFDDNQIKLFLVFVIFVVVVFYLATKKVSEIFNVWHNPELLNRVVYSCNADDQVDLVVKIEFGDTINSRI